MKIEQILSSKGPEVITVTPQERIVTVLSLLAEHGVGALVVSADGRHIEGIVSERDIVRAMAADPDAGTTGGVRPKPVSSLMSAEVVTVGLDTSIDEAMTTMTESRFRHLPVVDDDGFLAGIVSIGDVVKAKLTSLEEEKSALLEYVHRGG